MAPTKSNEKALVSTLPEQNASIENQHDISGDSVPVSAPSQETRECTYRKSSFDEMNPLSNR